MDLADNSMKKAMDYLLRNKRRAFAHFLVALNLRPDWRDDNKTCFVELTEDVAKDLLHERRVNDFFKCYEQALYLYPENAQMNRYFGKHLLDLGYAYRAFSFFKNAVKINPGEPLWQRELDNLKNLLIERWHFRMLNDSKRNRAYKDAILQCVKNQDSVLDIGCGSGILTLFAAEAHPRRLVSIDSNEALYNVALCVFKNHDIEDVSVINQKSTNLFSRDIGGLVTTVITETFDAGFFGEGILQTMIHARRVLMRNSSTDKVIPKSGNLYICGIESLTLARKHLFLANHLKDTVKFNGLQVFKELKEPYDTEDVTKIMDLKYVTDVVQLLHVNFLDADYMEMLLNGDENIEPLQLVLNCDAHIHAYVVWFELKLTDDISITTDPRSKDRCNAWEQAIFYLNSPLVCVKSNSVTVKLSCESGKLKLLQGGQGDYQHFPVSSEVIKYLNDSNFINHADTAASAACVHLAQLYSLNSINILDMSPFPIVGFLLLARGAQNLTFPSGDWTLRHLIFKVAQLNGLDKRKITFLNSAEESLVVTDTKFHIIVNNYFMTGFGELNIKNIEVARSLRIHKVEAQSLAMPFTVRMLAKAIYSEEIERVNRISNSNVFGYEIAEYMNIFESGQISVSNITAFNPVEKSDNIVVFEQCLIPCTNKIIEFELSSDGLINGVITWYEVQLFESGDFYSTNDPGSSLDCAIHVLEPGLTGVKDGKASLLISCDEIGSMKIAIDLDSQ